MVCGSNGQFVEACDITLKLGSEMRSFCFACVLALVSVAVLASEGDLPGEVLSPEAAVAQMVKMTKAARSDDRRLTVNCVVSRADQQTVQYRAPLLTAAQRKMLPGETATQRAARLQALVDELQRQKVQQPLVTRIRHTLSPTNLGANGFFHIVLSEQVVADLKRLGIDNLNDHFAGKSVTVRGNVTWADWTIDAAPQNFELHVDTLADIVEVKTADKEAIPKP